MNWILLLKLNNEIISRCSPFCMKKCKEQLMILRENKVINLNYKIINSDVITDNNLRLAKNYKIEFNIDIINVNYLL